MLVIGLVEFALSSEFSNDGPVWGYAQTEDSHSILLALFRPLSTCSFPLRSSIGHPSRFDRYI